MKGPVIELTGTSTTSIEGAVVRAIRRRRIKVVETRGDINKGKVDHPSKPASPSKAEAS